MKTWPWLYKKNSTGAIQDWMISVEGSEIITTYGLVGGKHQTAHVVIEVGKALGKRNATTSETQALAEAEATWVKKTKKGYVESIIDAKAGIVADVIEGGVNPMLAHVFEEQSDKISYPALVQPKLDGNRCIAVCNSNSDITLWTRTRKPINSVPHVIVAIEKMLHAGKVKMPIIFDGELFNYDYRNKFEELQSFIRSDEPKPGHEVVQYWIYDVADANLKNQERRVLLDGLLHHRGVINMPGAYDNATIQIVATIEVGSEAMAVAARDMFIAQGYEGAMIRNMQAKYEFKRSVNLQKMKKMQDAEFLIVGVEKGRGKMADCAIFVCKAANGDIFNCKMEGALENLKKYLEKPELYIGKYLTVRFQSLSNYGIPRFPVGLRIREE
jgi:DNA ligase-1